MFQIVLHKLLRITNSNKNKKEVIKVTSLFNEKLNASCWEEKLREW